ncbi:S9 family peptidase [Formicincola oecophyllae]|uniref:S9 family peptidase n=1 Tax=Formicincola oecophyllae TaxID=2558361 RepID=A0A4Y6U9W6_9PROT|nr:S9 family peptidase [Formicincola oecophyllae]QDH13368.1 S9 family peptidase [Formicincola oecophyllae]
MTTSNTTQPPQAPVPKAPHAPQRPVTHEQLGRTRTDPYGWMKDERWQEILRDPTLLRPDIRQHLECENAYAAATLQATEELQKTLFEEMKARLPATDSSVPVPDGPWLYGRRYQEGEQYPQFTRAKRGQPAGTETTLKGAVGLEVLLDVPSRAANQPFYSLGGVAHSPDHAFLAFSEDTQGSEVYRIHVRDLTTGALMAGVAENTTGSFVISPDSQWLFWVHRDDHGRPSAIWRRPLQDGSAKPVLVFKETNPGYFLELGVSLSRDWIMVTRGDHDTNETLLIPASQPTAAPIPFAPVKAGERYSLTHWGDRFIITTNHLAQGAEGERAVDFQLMQVEDNPETLRQGRAAWEPFLPHQAGRYILGASACQNWLAWSERHDGLETIQVISRTKALQTTPATMRMAARAIKPREEASSLSLLGFLEWQPAEGEPELRYIYQSPTTPPHWYDHNPTTGEDALRKVRAVPSGHNPEDYVTKRLHARSDDGALVPITVLMKRGQALDATAPLLLYGYGSYGIPMEASFSTTALSLVDRGWIYAVAHVRGGSEKGWNWFLEGRGKNKPNTFRDFIAAANHLVAEDYTAPKRIVAQGGSAGGMLMGAVANMAPGLFAGIAAQVPFVDVLNTMSDASLPLTPPEWPEWGNPLTNAEDYDLIASYSPYDNITSQPYPPILAMGGLSDPRVTYWEPAKWIARLRDTGQGGPFLCRINMEAGHGGSSGRYKRLEESALVQAFAIWAVGRQGLVQLQTQ